MGAVDVEVMVEAAVEADMVVEVVAAATAVVAVDTEVAATEVDVAVEVEDMAVVATRPPLDQVQTSPSKRSIFDLRFPFMHISYYSAMQYCQPKSVFFLHLISDHFS